MLHSNFWKFALGITLVLFSPYSPALRADPATQERLVNGDFSQGLTGWKVAASDFYVDAGVLRMSDGDAAMDAACLRQTVKGIGAGATVSFSIDTALETGAPRWGRTVDVELHSMTEGELNQTASSFSILGNDDAAPTRVRVSFKTERAGDVGVAICIGDDDPRPVLLSRARLLVTETSGNDVTNPSFVTSPVAFTSKRGTCPNDLRVEEKKEQGQGEFVVHGELVTAAVRSEGLSSHSFSPAEGHVFELPMRSEFSDCSANGRDALGRTRISIRNSQMIATLDIDSLEDGTAAHTFERIDMKDRKPFWIFSRKAP
ncbi:MAG: hypothetical protein IOD12_00250 [Silvanigrellales bacterium]|nr:hypothetical protein [Silvanigrellales bacterium]